MSCAQLWKTAHCLTKGSKSLDTFCLSPLLYAWWERQEAEYFPSNRSMIFHLKCRVPLLGLHEHLRSEGSTLRNGMKFSSTQMVYLKCFLKQVGVGWDLLTGWALTELTCVFMFSCLGQLRACWSSRVSANMVTQLPFTGFSYPQISHSSQADQPCSLDMVSW